MRIVRAIGIGILLWVLIFAEISIFQIGLQLTRLFAQVVHYILLIPIGILGAWMYYKSGDEVNGFLLGIFVLITGIILDALITVPVFLEGNYADFYADPFLWVGFLVLVVVFGTYDLARQK